MWVVFWTDRCSRWGSRVPGVVHQSRGVCDGLRRRRLCRFTTSRPWLVPRVLHTTVPRGSSDSIAILGVAPLRVWQELHMNQEASLVDFDDEGFSATVQFYSEDMQEGSMVAYLTRGMVRFITSVGYRTSNYLLCWIPDIELSQVLYIRYRTITSLWSRISNKNCVLCRYIDDPCMISKNIWFLKRLFTGVGIDEF